MTSCLQGIWKQNSCRCVRSMGEAEMEPKRLVVVTLVWPRYLGSVS